MKFGLHPLAQAEHNLQIAYFEAYYENESVGLGARYHQSVRQAIENACMNPQIHRRINNTELRTVAVSGFPYRVIFHHSEEFATVLAISHNRREPAYWVERL